MKFSALILCISSSFAVASSLKSSSIITESTSTAGVSSSAGLLLSLSFLLLRLSLLLPLAFILLHFLIILSSKKSSNSAITSYAVNDTTEVCALKKEGPWMYFFLFTCKVILGNMPHLVFNELFALSLNCYDTSYYLVSRDWTTSTNHISISTFHTRGIRD